MTKNTKSVKRLRALLSLGWFLAILALITIDEIAIGSLLIGGICFAICWRKSMLILPGTNLLRFMSISLVFLAGFQVLVLLNINTR